MNTNLVNQNKAFTDCYSEIESLVAICGAKAIDNIMSQNDPNWFAAFKQQEASMPEARRTVQPYHTSILDSDFQGIVKIFRYRELPSDIVNVVNPILVSDVFNHYNLPDRSCGPKAFSELCNTLISNRNLVHHVSAEAISGNDENKIKSHIIQCKKSIFDCIRFLEYFSDVRDSNGVSYLDRASQKLDQTEKSLGISSYNIPELLSREDINISIRDFVDLCADLHFDTYYRNGIAYLETENLGTSLAVIKTVIERTPQKPKNSNNKFGLLIGLLIALIVGLMVVIVLLLPKSGDSNLGEGANSVPTGSITTNSSDATITSSSADSSDSSSREQITRYYDPILKDEDYVTNKLVIVPKEVRYEEEKLVCDVYVVSGYNSDIESIYIKNVKIINSDGVVIAEKTFDYTQSLFIHHWYNNTEHSFTLSGSDIVNKNADLTNLVIESEIDAKIG